MSSKVQSSRSFFNRWKPSMPSDYLARRRLFRNISGVVMVALLSVLVAGVILYTSNPGGFAGH